MCSTSTPTSRPIVTAQAMRPSVCEMLKRKSGVPVWGIEDFGPAVHVLDEAPIGWSHRRIARQHRPHMCARDDECASISIEHQPRHSLVLVLREKRLVRIELVERRRVGGVDEIDVHGGNGQDVHRRFTSCFCGRHPDRDAAGHHGDDGEADADLRAVLFHQIRGPLAVQHGEIALAKVPDAAADHDRRPEAPRRHRGRPRHQHEQLERHGRRQKSRHHHRQQSVLLIQLQRAIDVATLEPLAHEGFAASPRHTV